MYPAFGGGQKIVRRSLHAKALEFPVASGAREHVQQRA
jgi:hypothetical protein